MAVKWIKKKDMQEKKDASTAEFKDFYADNVYKVRKQNPVEVKIEGSK